MTTKYEKKTIYSEKDSPCWTRLNDRQKDDIRDIAVDIVGQLVIEGLCPDCTDTDNDTEFQIQDIIFNKMVSRLDIYSHSVDHKLSAINEEYPDINLFRHLVGEINISKYEQKKYVEIVNAIFLEIFKEKI